MSAPPISAAEFSHRNKEQLEAVYNWAGSDRAVARWLTENGRTTSQSTINKARSKFGIPTAQECYRTRGTDPGPGSLVEPEAPAVTVNRDRETLRLKDELSDLRKKYQVACATGNLHEDILGIARDVMGRTSPAKVLPPKVGKGQTEEDAILAWSDWHGGEVIDYDVMQGYNCYGPEIMCRRAQYTVDHTLGILFGCHMGTTFGRLYVFDLGDGINGDNLDEQMATNALPVFEAMRMVALVKAEALTELSVHLPITYVSVPGNHGRRNPKMQWKLPTETADWLIGEMIADRVRDNARIECINARSWTVGVTVRGFNHVLNHGFTAAKGGFGGISWYSFQRADGQKTAIEAAYGKRVHHRWYGHIHQTAEIPMTDGEGEQHIIGSLGGGNEYALEGLNRYSAPAQKLVGCHDEYGVTWRYPLNVGHSDNEPSRYEDLLSQS